MKALSIAHAGISYKKQWPIEVSLKTHWTSGNKEYYLATSLKKRCIKEDYKGIHDRFLRDHIFRGRMIENSQDEEVCRAWDVLADEDHSYHMSEQEYFYYKNNWWISLNKSGNDTQTLRKRSGFKQALSTLKRLHQEAGGETNSSPFLPGSTNNGDQHRVLPLLGGIGNSPCGLPENSQKVKKEEASKGL